MSDALTLAGIYIYPIKSCRGIALTEAALTGYGLALDRQWMVVDDRGRFLTQRRFPAMARIVPALAAEGLTVTAPGMAPLTVASSAPYGEQPVAVRVWGFEGIAADAGAEAAAWLSHYLGLACRLVALGSQFQRPVEEPYNTGADHIAFADGFPLLLIGEGSLADLNARLEMPVPMDRFRPNLVVAGSEAFAEDGWRRIAINGVEFTVAKPCSRCAIPSVDQATGERGAEPGRTLASYRQGEDGEVYFGQNLIHHTSAGLLRVGDGVTVLA
ncbi:MAG: MOSC domain-containing protein [Candidatus Competibacterales bacterium]